VVGYVYFVSPALPSLLDLRASVAAWPRLAKGGLLPTELIGVAVSGGADSVYLLLALWADETLRPRLRVLHFNHRVRGEAAEDDARFVQALCVALDVPHVIGERGAVGLASEADLRAARLDFFAQQRTALGLRVIATAHHLDDVVETMLMRLARGAGLAGLAAPREWQVFRAGHVHWRPLIGARLTKAELLATLSAGAIPWHEDATNLQPIALRNRARAWVGQGGSEALGPTFTQGFGASARYLDDAHTALLAWADELGCTVQPDGSIGTAALRGRPPALAHAVLSRFLAEHGLSSASGPSLEPLIAALGSGCDAQSTLLAQLVVHKADRLFLPRSMSVTYGPELRPLVLGQLDDASGLLAERVDVDDALWAKLSRGDISADSVAYLNVPQGLDLAWRGRMEGDRYQPLGSSGSAKLSDLLINRKIPVEQRESLPVVLVDNTIHWVPGQPPAHSARLVGPQKGALRLTWLGPCLSSVLPR